MKVAKAVANHCSSMWPTSRASSPYPCSFPRHVTRFGHSGGLAILHCSEPWPGRSVREKGETRDPKQRRVDIAKGLKLSLSIVTTVFGQWKAVEPNRACTGLLFGARPGSMPAHSWSCPAQAQANEKPFYLGPARLVRLYPGLAQARTRPWPRPGPGPRRASGAKPKSF